MSKPPSLPPKPPAPSAPPKAPPARIAVPRPSAQVPAKRAVKTFGVADWSGTTEGEKVVIYGKSGIGKTSLAAQIPGAIFIGLDDGGRKITNPITGQPVKAVQGITSVYDLRDALNQASLWPDGCSIVIDTVTKFEELSEAYLFENYKTKKGTATSMRDFGWDGAGYLLDTLRLLLTDLDPHIRKGHNVILLSQLAQVRVANAEGTDYLEDGPKLQHNNQYSSRTELCEWSDHVLRVGYLDSTVIREEGKKVGKVSGDETRAVFSGGARHFIAKSRPIDGYRIPTVIPFETHADNSLWQFLLEGAKAAE
jgi:energy-coupling factor transporter ATP-binding protein EcfA2